MYRTFSYSNHTTSNSPTSASIAGAWIEQSVKPGGTPQPILGVGHYGSVEHNRIKQFGSVTLQGQDRENWAKTPRGYLVPSSRSIFQITRNSHLGYPEFAQYSEGEPSTQFCLVQLLPGFKYGGSNITGDLPPERRVLSQDFAENAEPLSRLFSDGLSIILEGKAAPSQGVFWAPHYLLFLPREVVLRVEFGGSHSFPKVVDYLYFNGVELEKKRLEDRLVEGGW